MPNFENQANTVANIVNEIDLVPPVLKQVVLLNDDYTTTDFVVSLLMNVFDKNMDQAHEITMIVHNTGEGVCGIYPYDIAELKFITANRLAKNSGEPLRIILRDI